MLKQFNLRCVAMAGFVFLPAGERIHPGAQSAQWKEQTPGKVFPNIIKMELSRFPVPGNPVCLKGKAFCGIRHRCQPSWRHPSPPEKPQGANGMEGRKKRLYT